MALYEEVGGRRRRLSRLQLQKGVAIVIALTQRRQQTFDRTFREKLARLPVPRKPIPQTGHVGSSRAEQPLIVTFVGYKLVTRRYRHATCSAYAHVNVSVRGIAPSHYCLELKNRRFRA